MHSPTMIPFDPALMKNSPRKLLRPTALSIAPLLILKHLVLSKKIAKGLPPISLFPKELSGKLALLPSAYVLTSNLIYTFLPVLPKLTRPSIGNSPLPPGWPVAGPPSSPENSCPECSRCGSVPCECDATFAYAVVLYDLV